MSTITLPNIRVGSDLQVRVRLKDGGVAIDWSTLQNIKACIYSDAQRALAGRCAFSIDEEDSTLLVCTYAANKPQYLGVNRIVISAKYMGETKTYDKPAFSFVRWTADQEGEEITIDDPDVDVEIDVEDISSSILQEAVDAAFTAADRANEAAAAAEHMVDIHTGPEGKSAYEVAVEEGYTGTEEEWLASLKGDTGETPDISIGTVTTVAPGTPAAASMTGTPEEPVLNLSIPQGVVGATPNFTVGTVTTGEPGSSVIVTITGTPEAPVLNLTIPQGMQGNTGSSVEFPYELVNNLTTNDATKGLSAAQGVVLDGKVSQLEAKVNQSFSGHLGFGDTKTTIIPTSLAPYTDAHGMVTLSANEPSYLWLCMTTPGWVAESSGIEIPMEDMGVIGGYYCYVSVEKISGVVNFYPVKLVKVKSDTDRLVITARSYAITYGDAIPTFGYTANGEVDGTPTITCQATQTSGAGIYEIVISRGTVTDENAVYENGTLVIAKAELTVRAENKYVALNGTMPAFTMQYSGFVNGEDATDLTTAPTGTTTAQGTGTAGNYPIVPSGGVSGNYNFNYVNGILSVDYCLQYVQAQLADSGSCGGFIGASGTYYGKWRTSTTYIGIILDIRRYAGATIRFVRKMDRPNLRFALLTSPTFTANQDAAFSSAPGYDAPVEITYQEGDTYNDVVIPADANYLYVYVLSEGVYAGPAAIQFRGIPAPEMEMKNLSDVTFSTNTSIGTDGTVWTGTSAPTVVCSDYILANDYAHIGVAKFLCNNPPEGGDHYTNCIAYYDPNKVFIRRDAYADVEEAIADAPSYVLPPSCGYMRLMVVAHDGEASLPGDTIYFSGDDLQITGTETE